ncbi:signal recognition particle-docking protein FtsY [Pseudomonas putida]|jgi:fused signal recognition particle receptor|nr:signal recognition particle-docking protein FtsY [Pseudomonas putida]
MFGSNDDKKTPAPAGEKKGLFGWLRKKPQTPVAEQPPTPAAQDPVTDAEATVQTSVETAVALAPEPVLAPRAEVDRAPAEPPAAQGLVLPVPEEPVALVEDDAPQAPPAIAPRPEVAVVPVAEPVAAPTPAPAPAPAPVPPPAAAIAPAARPTPVTPAPVPAPVAQAMPPAVVAPQAAAPAKAGFFARLKQGLSKTSASLGEGMASLFLGSKLIDDDLLEELETRLLTADVGVEATSVIIQSLTRKVARKELTDAAALYKALQGELTALLRPVEQPLVIKAEHQPFVILVVGVNGAGKTTTIGKLAKKLQLEGKKVMLAAGDTFRAAAVEQLQVWGERNKIPVIAQHTGADSASVIFDAVQAAKSRGIDVLIADTAGRLHTKDNLMEELKKVRRVMGKLDEQAPHEVLLVLDAGTGQNAINQAKQFNQTVALTGLALTKLDGTAKGGVIFALAKQFGLPIRYIGVGEGIDDLRTFEAEPFVQALFAEREPS